MLWRPESAADPPAAREALKAAPQPWTIVRTEHSIVKALPGSSAWKIQRPRETGAPRPAELAKVWGPASPTPMERPMHQHKPQNLGTGARPPDLGRRGHPTTAAKSVRLPSCPKRCNVASALGVLDYICEDDACT